MIVKISSWTIFEDKAEMSSGLEGLVHFDNEWMGDGRQELSFLKKALEVIWIELFIFLGHLNGREGFGGIYLGEDHVCSGTLSDLLNEGVIVNLGFGE